MNTNYNNVMQAVKRGGGETLNGVIEPTEVLERSPLNWEVEQWPLYAMEPEPDGDFKEEDLRVETLDWRANVRGDTKEVLGLVSPDYNIVQNRQVLDVLHLIVEEGNAEYVGAGTFRGGKELWCLTKTDNDFIVGVKDAITTFVLTTWGHAGGTAIKVAPMAYRMVCTNGMMDFDKLKGTFSIWHRGDPQEMIEAAQSSVRRIDSSHKRIADQSQLLAKRQLKAPEIRDYFDRLFPTTVGDPEKTDKPVVATERAAAKNLEILTSIKGLFDSEENRQLKIDGSAWAAYNAVSSWADHERTTPGTDDTKRAENRLRSTWLGPASEIKARAWEAALTLSA